MSYRSVIINLSHDEYLDFMIDTVFCFYKDKKLKFSIYDCSKNLRFVTDENLNFQGFNPDDFGDVSEIEMLKSSRELKSSLNFALDRVISTQNNLVCVVFMRFLNSFGALHIKLAPLFHDGEVCGVLLQKTISSKLFYSLRAITQIEPRNSKLTITNKQIGSLSKRERDTLYLTLLNFSMPDISKMLLISPGTVRTYITRICEKFDIQSSTFFIQDKLNRVDILNALLLPDIKFDPVAILIEGHDEYFHFWTRLDKFEDALNGS